MGNPESYYTQEITERERESSPSSSSNASDAMVSLGMAVKMMAVLLADEMFIVRDVHIISKLTPSARSREFVFVGICVTARQSIERGHRAERMHRSPIDRGRETN